MRNKLLASVLFIFGLVSPALSQIIVTPVSNLQTAIQNSLLGAGIVVNNITYQGVPNSLSEFTGTSSIGISNGLFLSTGSTTSLNNPSAFFMSDQAAAPGDPDLQVLSSGTIQDAAVLEFDFKVAGDSVKFNFVFASEEYSDYANTAFNDVFGFFISGPGITGNQNIALVPGTALPVSINNVNSGNSAAGIIPTGPCMNCAYFHDNTNDTTNAFDGFTTILTATAAVQPCTFYHIKLAVGNVNDGAFDSGVLLEANSFQYCGPITIFEGLAPVNDTLEICNGSSATLSSCLAPNYLWSTGSTMQSIIVTQPGIYAVSVSGNNCSASSSQITVISDTTFIKPVITQIANQLFSSVISGIYNYQWFLNGVSISNSNNSTLPISTDGCYTVLISSQAGCTAISDSVCVTMTGIINNGESLFSFTTIPNPSHDLVKISFLNEAGDIYCLRFFDISGKKLDEIHSRSNNILLTRPVIQSGIYFIELENTKSGMKTRKKIAIN